MNDMRIWTALAAFAVGFIFSSGGAVGSEKGKTAYMKFGCWQCHGTVGQGGLAGLKLAPDPIPYDKFAAFVRTTNRAMPPYRESVLSNDDLTEIYAYLEAIPSTPNYKSIPLLNQ